MIVGKGDLKNSRVNENWVFKNGMAFQRRKIIF